jgi:anaphase-promoting complex subunit 8
MCSGGAAGNYYSLKGLRDRAVEYFHRAVLLDASFATAWTLMGHEFVNLKNERAAITSYRRAIGAPSCVAAAPAVMG